MESLELKEGDFVEVHVRKIMSSKEKK